MTGGRMHEDTFALLRHIEVNGPRTRAEAAAGLRRPPNELTKVINNLAMMGYLAKDETTQPICFALTSKARKRLAQGFEPPPPMQPRKAREKPEPHPQLSATQARLVQAAQPKPTPAQYVPARRERSSSVMSAPYTAREYQPSHRPGAMTAFDMPSRVADTLRYRDGRVTDMAGNPIE